MLGGVALCAELPLRSGIQPLVGRLVCEICVPYTNPRFWMEGSSLRGRGDCQGGGVWEWINGSIQGTYIPQVACIS